MPRCRRRPKRAAKRWTREEEQRLRWCWGQIDGERLARQLGRTLSACRQRAVLLGLPGATQGYLSLERVAERLGYDPTTIVRLAELRGIRLRRRPITTPKRGHLRGRQRRYAITEEQVAQLESALGELGWPSKIYAQWAPRMHIDACLRCGTSERPHLSRGLCRRCYRAELRAHRLDRWSTEREVRRAA